MHAVRCPCSATATSSPASSLFIPPGIMPGCVIVPTRPRIGIAPEIDSEQYSSVTAGICSDECPAARRFGLFQTQDLVFAEG